jgi:hypothetical protein
VESGSVLAGACICVDAKGTGVHLRVHMQGVLLALASVTGFDVTSWHITGLLVGTSALLQKGVCCVTTSVRNDELVSSRWGLQRLLVERRLL